MRKLIVLEDVGPGDFFVTKSVESKQIDRELYLAGDEAEINIRVKDGKGKSFPVDCTAVWVVTGNDLRKELVKAKRH